MNKRLDTPGTPIAPSDGNRVVDMASAALLSNAAKWQAYADTSAAGWEIELAQGFADEDRAAAALLASRPRPPGRVA